MTDRERTTQGAAPGASSEDPREARLQAMFTAAEPAADPSEALWQRVADLAARHESRAPRRRAMIWPGGPRWAPWRLGLGLAAAAALVMMGVGLAPTWIAARVLQRAEAAAAEVQNAHVTTWSIGPDGSRVKTREEWQQGDRSRTWERDGERIRLISSGKLWVYEPKLNKVTVRRLGGTAAHVPPVQTLQEMVREFARHGWRDQLRMLGDTFVNGWRVHQVAIQRPGWRDRGVLRVDAATDLPIEGEGQTEVDGRWVTRMLMEVHYNVPLPAALFEPSFPKSAEVFDLDRGQQEWGRHLAGEIAQHRVGDRTIVIRDIQVNAEGDLFLLYTAGKCPSDETLAAANSLSSRDWSIEVKDNLGTIYQWQPGNWAYNRHEPPGYPKGYVIHGERVEGDWWIPVAPQSPWLPRQFTLTFHVYPKNLHAGDHVPERRASNGPVSKASYTETAVFTLPVAASATALVPDYMPYMGLGLMFDDASMRSSHERARAFYYRYEQSDLAKALDHYREVIRQDQQRARETGLSGPASQAWLDLGEVLRQMGQKQEARAALEESVRAAVYPDGARKRAEEALEALNGDMAWSAGHPAPSFAATDLNGQPQSPERYRGQVLLIDLWATWDEKTRTDLPTLKALYDQYSGKGLAILGIGVDRHKPAFRKFVKECALPWPQVHDGKGWGGPLHRSFGSPKPPRTFLIDRQGTIRSIDLHGPALEKAVAALLIAR